MKVLIAIDSSGFADEVLNEISRRSWAKETEFSILTAIEPSQNWEAGQEYLHQGRIILDGRVKSLKERMPQHEISGHAHQGSAAAVINRTAQEWGANLIVIGSHGDTGHRKAGIGSVAAAVVNEAPCSVEVVKLKKDSAQKHSTDTAASRHH